MIVTKYENPSQTLIYSVYLISKELNNKRILPYAELKDFLSKKVEGGEYWYETALNFMFLMGRIQYYPKTDMIEFLNNETK